MQTPKQQQKLRIWCKPSHRVHNLGRRESSRISIRHSSAMRRKMRAMWLTLMKLNIQWMKSGTCTRNVDGIHTVMIDLHVWIGGVPHQLGCHTYLGL